VVDLQHAFAERDSRSSLGAEQEFDDEYGEGIGADDWNGQNGHTFETAEEEKMWMEDERTFFNTVSTPPST
jgi:hypothetical protein